MLLWFWQKEQKVLRLNSYNNLKGQKHVPLWGG